MRIDGLAEAQLQGSHLSRRRLLESTRLIDFWITDYVSFVPPCKLSTATEHQFNTHFNMPRLSHINNTDQLLSFILLDMKLVPDTSCD